MPSHLAAPSVEAAGPNGGGERPGPAAGSTRRSLRARRAERGEVEALPGVEELLAADEALGGGDVVSPHAPRDGGLRGRDAGSGSGAADGGERGGSALVGASAVAGPTVRAQAPLTRREARQRAEASASRPLPAPSYPTATRQRPAAATAPVPSGAVALGGGGALALAERPAPSTPWSAGTTWSPGSSGLGFTAELELSGLRPLPAPVSGGAGDDVIVLPPTPVVAPHGAPPTPLTRRARREIEELERALALPAASPGRSRERHLMAVALSPDGDLASDHLDPVGLAEMVEMVEAAPDARRRRRGAQARSAFGLPQAGMVGVLGLAVLVGPTLGQVAHADTAPAPVPTSQPSLPPTPIGAVADLPAPAVSEQVVPTLAPGESVPLRAEELLAKREQAEQASRAIGERTLAAEAAARADAERQAAVAALAPGCDGQVDAATMRASNGELPDADLCVLWDGTERLRPDAALAMARLDMAYRDAFGTDLPVSDAYRSYGSQVEVRRTKPGLSARPGTSQHGWGVAVDLGGSIATGGEGYRWLVEHAGEFGWENPAWARPGGSGPHEPWHWEYAAGRGLAHTG